MTAAVDPGVRMRAWAADLMIKAGWQLAPCRIVLRPNNAGELKKMPDGLMGGWQNQACRTVAEFDAACAEVERRVGGPATGYLISCGPSGIVAADADGDAGIATLASLGVPPTMTVDTPHGLHAIYAADPTKPVRNSQVAGPGLDIRGVGGGLFGPGSVVLGPDGSVAGEWRARYPVTAPVIMPAAIAAIGATNIPDRSTGNVRELPPATRREPSTLDSVNAAMAIATKYFQVMQDECERPTGKWNDALYQFTRWMGRWVATRGYDDVDTAIDTVRFAVVQSMIQNPLMTEPDDKDSVTIGGKAAIVGLRQGPYELNEPVEVSPLWGLAPPIPGVPGDHAAESPGVQPAEQVSDETGWAPFNLADILSGDFVAPKAGIMFRADGVGLFYAGSVNALMGEPESGKTWVALYAAVQSMRRGEMVAMLDYESEAPEVVGRLLALGATKEQIQNQFHYRKPAIRIGQTEALPHVQSMMQTPYSLIVLDGVTDALGTEGKSMMDNDDVSSWYRQVLRPLARITGAAVVTVDHVPKNGGANAKYAIGAQAKLASSDGVTMLVEVIQQFTPGQRGSARLMVAKDRKGSVRAMADRPTGENRMAHVATFTLNSEMGFITASVDAPVVETEQPRVDFVEANTGIGAAFDALPAGLDISGALVEVARWMAATAPADIVTAHGQLAQSHAAMQAEFKGRKSKYGKPYSPNTLTKAWRLLIQANLVVVPASSRSGAVNPPMMWNGPLDKIPQCWIDRRTIPAPDERRPE